MMHDFFLLYVLFTIFYNIDTSWTLLIIFKHFIKIFYLELSICVRDCQTMLRW